MSPEQYADIPEIMELREVRFHVHEPGCRVKTISHFVRISTIEHFSDNGVIVIRVIAWIGCFEFVPMIPKDRLEYRLINTFHGCP